MSPGRASCVLDQQELCVATLISVELHAPNGSCGGVPCYYRWPTTADSSTTCLLRMDTKLMVMEGKRDNPREGKHLCTRG